MFVKTIQLLGFKSFAVKTEIDFVKGMTAVVGPNGSGKSNVSDAIRWVLGEQSVKALRGGKMEDVIFSGSEARKAVNYAEVCLTLNNEDQFLPVDYEEVTITRRLHRSGESEYFINKQGCRLKDITQLFMDTGVGKESYSIIGQGRMEEILSTRAEDRRGLFEEAAGIVKYKTRKKEAMRKLEETEQHLLRVNDLIVEIQQQIEPLRIQAEKADRYNKLFKRLRRKEIGLHVHRIDELHRLWTEMSGELERLKVEQTSIATSLSKHDAQFEQDRFLLRQLDERVDALQSDLLKITQQVEQTEGHYKLLKERSNYLAHQCEQQQAAVNANKACHDSDQQALLHEQHALQQGMDELKQVQQQLSVQVEQLRYLEQTSGELQEEQLKQTLSQTLQQITDTQNEIRYIDQHIESLQQRMNDSKEQHYKWEQQRKHLQHCQEKADVSRMELEQAMQQLKVKASIAHEHVVALDKSLQEKEAHVRDGEQKHHTLVSRKDALKEMQDDFEGFMSGVKGVLQAARQEKLNGVHGAVAELIRVPQQLELAVETVLGGSLQHIVMEDEAACRQAISYLKQRQLGKATFLPLNVIRARTIPKEQRITLTQMNGFIGIANEQIDSEPRYTSIIANLLGTVIIAENMDAANEIAAQCQHRFRVVTLEGDMVNVGGSMTGGSVRRPQFKLLARTRQLEQLDYDINQSKTQLAQLQTEYEHTKSQRQHHKEEIEHLLQLQQQHTLQIQQLTFEIKQFGDQLQHMTEQLVYTKTQLDQFSEEQAKYERDRVAAYTKQQDLAVEQQNIQHTLTKTADARKTYQSTEHTMRAHVMDLKIKEAKLEQVCLSMRVEVDRWKKKLEKIEKEINENNALLTAIQTERAENAVQQKQQLDQLQRHKTKREQLLQELNFTRADRSERCAKLDIQDIDTKEQRSLLQSIQATLVQTEIRANRVDVKLDALLKKLSEDYQMSYELAKQRYDLSDEIQKVHVQVSDLQREITELGSVNTGAIDQFQQLQQRAQFLHDQKEDLVAAKTTLYDIIDQMDHEMSKKFKTTFQAIREQFQHVFSQIFGGGTADLILLDEKHLLQTGIDIIAQPPGKKLQNMLLLSGGERSLTAIALLFSILKVCPVPFCVLDEVEAALDEANVGRFAKYVRQFSQHTQFIIVTHRKATMAEADALYGITMQEGGVSKLMSISLTERVVHKTE